MELSDLCLQLRCGSALAAPRRSETESGVFEGQQPRVRREPEDFPSQVFPLLAGLECQRRHRRRTFLPGQFGDRHALAAAAAQAGTAARKRSRQSALERPADSGPVARLGARGIAAEVGSHRSYSRGSSVGGNRSGPTDSHGLHDQSCRDAYCGHGGAGDWQFAAIGRRPGRPVSSAECAAAGGYRPTDIRGTSPCRSVRRPDNRSGTGAGRHRQSAGDRSAADGRRSDRRR